MAFRPSEATEARIRALLTANKERELTPAEARELDEFEHVEHLVRMLKLHTQKLIDQV